MKIAIAGASGFIGKALLQELKENHQLIALSRSDNKSDSSNIEWRSCDLFSLLDSEKGLEGADVAIYLVHSMRPSAQLSQGSFEDFDLILADNFLRAAKSANVKHVLYLGGLFPEDSAKASAHLKSRHEIEELFKDGGVPYTILRAPVILGGEGSSFHIMARLVERLPVMLCPKWTHTKSEPISLTDVINCICYCLNSADAKNKVYDLGGPEDVTYIELMKRIAALRGLNRWWIPIPLLTPRLSALWVCMITGAPRALVLPLIEGLRTKLIARTDRRLFVPRKPLLSLNESLIQALSEYDNHQTPLAFQKSSQGLREVRSVQRLFLPKGKTAEEIAKAYMKFLPRSGPGLLKVDVDGDWLSFKWKFPETKLLILQYAPHRSGPHRQLFYVRGGLLAQKTVRGRLEFREILGGKAIIAAIHEFRPRIPWFIYRWTQAIIHVQVMNQFGRHLKRKNPT